MKRTTLDKANAMVTKIDEITSMLRTIEVNDTNTYDAASVQRAMDALKKNAPNKYVNVVTLLRDSLNNQLATLTTALDTLNDVAL
jgi:uncharacterized coiled-coil DUF342 family protein